MFYLWLFCICRHTALEVDVKSQDPDLASEFGTYASSEDANLQQAINNRRMPPLYDDVTRSEPNLTKPEPVILESVPSLKNLSESHLPSKLASIHVKPALNLTQKVFLQSKSMGVEAPKPIFPSCPFSPYASPTSSPRTNRKRQPLKESRRVSIEKSGSYLQLNQYKLMDSIGQVNRVQLL